MTNPIDCPLMVAPSPVKDLELAAIAAYRAANPAAIPWQDLHEETRLIWMKHAEAK